MKRIHLFVVSLLLVQPMAVAPIRIPKKLLRPENPERPWEKKRKKR